MIRWEQQENGDWHGFSGELPVVTVARLADQLFQHRPAADEFDRPQISRAQVQEVEGVEAGRPLALAPKRP